MQIKNMFTSISLVPLGIRHKLMISFALMSIIPLLICGYIVSSYIFPTAGDIKDVSIILLISISMAFLGLYIAKEIVDAVVQLSKDAGALAKGDFNKILTKPTDDEIGEICNSLKDLVEHIQLTSIRDKLTQFYNKNYLSEKLPDDIKMAVSLEYPCAFVILGLDNYQDIKVKAGQTELDDLVKKVADIVKKSVSEDTKILRVQEDQFALFLPQCNKNSAYNIAEKIRKLIKDSGLSVSGGVSAVPVDSVEVSEIVAKAEKLMQDAVDQGRNRIII